MIVVCMGHVTDSGHPVKCGKFLREYTNAYAGPGISHGLCQDCKAVYERQMKAGSYGR